VAPLYIRVSGRVQGVGFRWYVRKAADRLRLSGWVRNCPDGTVEVACDGAPDAQDELIAAVRRGPPGADVARVDRLSADRLDPPITTSFRVMS
jgi:acylphosphatase